MSIQITTLFLKEYLLVTCLMNLYNYSKSTIGVSRLANKGAETGQVSKSECAGPLGGSRGISQRDWQAAVHLPHQYGSFSYRTAADVSHLMYRHTSLYCTSPSCTLQISKFCKLKVSGSPALSKCTGAIFPTVFAPFASVCHILVILTVF